LNEYKPALKYIGVDFAREDVQEAILNCYSGMEAAFQAVISYWKYKQQQQEKIYPSATLIEALKENWQPFDWRDEYLNDSRFKSSCLIWWEEAEQQWGREIRNQLIADVNETDGGEEYILLKTDEKIPLRIAKLRGWDWILDYAQSQITNDK
jgi:hypothetical protein